METYQKGGYFGKVLASIGGEGVPNNLKSFSFQKKVLNQYTDLSIRNPLEFELQEHVGVIYINHIGKWGLKCHILKNKNIGAILIDLARLPVDQQEWWADHLISE